MGCAVGDEDGGSTQQTPDAAENSGIQYAAFISHAHGDAAIAGEVVNLLESRGFGCWIAPRNVAGGRPYREQIASAIESSRLVILLLSRKANESDFVADEIGLAHDARPRKPILTLRLEEVEPNRELRVSLARLHRFDIFPKLENASEAVLTTVASHLNAPLPAVPVPAPKPSAGLIRLAGLFAASDLALLIAAVFWTGWWGWLMAAQGAAAAAACAALLRNVRWRKRVVREIYSPARTTLAGIGAATLMAGMGSAAVFLSRGSSLLIVIPDAVYLQRETQLQISVYRGRSTTPVFQSSKLPYNGRPFELGCVTTIGVPKASRAEYEERIARANLQNADWRQPQCFVKGRFRATDRIRITVWNGDYSPPERGAEGKIGDRFLELN